MQLEGQALAGKEAREKLFLANTRLVVSIAKRYQGLGLALPDLIQEGNLGLMKAIDRFDVSRGARLSTYATWWIRQTVARAVGNLGRTIRAPINQIQRAGKLKRIERKLTQSLKREPTLGELAEAADLTVDQTTYALRATRAPIDLDEWVSDDEEQRREELVADHASEDPESAAAEVLLKEAIWRVVDKLPGRLARIIDLRFGLTSGETQSLAQIGEKMGYSRERIRQLHHEALDQLRRIQDKHGLHEYLN
jgi:RNA polymerase primary sigma factor